MAALSVAEQVTASCPTPPSHINLNDANFDYIPETGFKRPMGVLLYFHQRVDLVREFAQAFGLVVADRPHPPEDTFTYAEGVIDGVPFRAWTLTPAEDAAVTR